MGTDLCVQHGSGVNSRWVCAECVAEQRMDLVELRSVLRRTREGLTHCRDRAATAEAGTTLGTPAALADLFDELLALTEERR